MNKRKEDFIDVDFEDISKHINGEPLFYTASQVAGLIGESLSTVRYWTKRFEDLLDIDISNKNKQYKKSDIAKLKFIKKLAKTDGLTLQQVEDYCTSKGFDIENIEKAIIDGSNPLAIQTLITGLTIELEEKMDNKFDILYEKIYQTLDNFLQLQKDMNLENKAEIESSVDMIMSNKSEQIKKDIQQEVFTIADKLDNQSIQLQQKFQSIIDENEKNATERDVKMTDNLNKNMEYTKKQYEEEQGNKKHKGFFSSITNIFHHK
jgi:DNA-binding transcriptional MerR regulator